MVCLGFFFRGLICQRQVHFLWDNSILRSEESLKSSSSTLQWCLPKSWVVRSPRTTVTFRNTWFLPDYHTVPIVAACPSGVRYWAALWPQDTGGSGAELKVEGCERTAGVGNPISFLAPGPRSCTMGMQTHEWSTRLPLFSTGKLTGARSFLVDIPVRKKQPIPHAVVQQFLRDSGWF